MRHHTDNDACVEVQVQNLIFSSQGSVSLKLLVVSSAAAAADCVAAVVLHQ